MSFVLFVHLCNYYVDYTCSLFVLGIVVLVNLYNLPQTPNSIVLPTMTAACCLTAAFSKVCKRLINQSRPVGAAKLSPGMPSNHATSVSFLLQMALFALQRWRKNNYLTLCYRSNEMQEQIHTTTLSATHWHALNERTYNTLLI